MDLTELNKKATQTATDAIQHEQEIAELIRNKMEEFSRFGKIYLSELTEQEQLKLLNSFGYPFSPMNHVVGTAKDTEKNHLMSVPPTIVKESFSKETIE